jgi:ArsR family transcriptional regulator
MGKLVRAAQAISDETRIRILNLLMSRECCVCEVMQALGISQTRASRNLKILDDAGFLNMRTDGLYTFYSIHDNGGDGFYVELLQAVEKEARADRTVKKDLQRLIRSRRVGPGCCLEAGASRSESLASPLADPKKLYRVIGRIK